MAKSLFHKNTTEKLPPTPYDLIGPEIDHLKKKGVSVRHGPGAKAMGTTPYVVFFALCGIGLLYCWDPIVHAWYKGEAEKTYTYLRNYGTGPQAKDLAATGIFSNDEINIMDHRLGSFQDYYRSPDAAGKQAEEIIAYTQNVHLLHEGKIQALGPLNRTRYLLFIYPGIYLPTSWTFLDPVVSE